jgi:hypothetical protein
MSPWIAPANVSSLRSRVPPLSPPLSSLSPPNQRLRLAGFAVFFAM